MTKKEERRLLIQECARQLFIEANIDQVTFSEIAKRAGVGEATVYRHFPNKASLAMAIGLAYVEDFSSNLVTKLKASEKTHLEQFEMVLDYYIDLYHNKPDYFIYLEHFDNFLAHNQEPIEGFDLYEAKFQTVTKAICDLEAGETVDGSVRKGLDLDLMTYTYNITFVSLCQKLLLRGRITDEDIRHEAGKELLLMKDIMVKSFK